MLSDGEIGFMVQVIKPPTRGVPFSRSAIFTLVRLTVSVPGPSV